jgi:hypothetical protein
LTFTIQFDKPYRTCYRKFTAEKAVQMKHNESKQRLLKPTPTVSVLSGFLLFPKGRVNMVFRFWSKATSCRKRQKKRNVNKQVFSVGCRNRRVANSPEIGLHARPATEIRGGSGSPSIELRLSVLLSVFLRLFPCITQKPVDVHFCCE